MTRLWTCIAIPLWLGCIRVPEIVLTDRATALEQQAAGSFAELERRLIEQGITARPVPLTPRDLEALGIRPPPLSDDIDLTDADAVDALLVQRCLGEARDGTLADTHESCRGAADLDEAGRLQERVNHARLQLFRYLQSRQPKVPAADLRRAWRQAHLHGVVCGAWVQRDDSTWEAKSC